MRKRATWTAEIEALRVTAEQRHGDYRFSLRFGTVEEIQDKFTEWQEARRELVLAQREAGIAADG